MSEVAYSSGSSEWSTPAELFDRLNKAFGFTLDVCASPENAKCDRFYTKEVDGLSQLWDGRIWMNPPYGRGIERWIKRAHDTALVHGCLVVGLIPARTDTRWWHRWIEGIADVTFLQGRIGFESANHVGRTRAPFPSAIAVWWPKPGGKSD